jgi:ribosomal protein S18 acetylase RimI-like enzyme
MRAALAGDAPAIAALHRDAMPTAFLPSLGDRFLRRLYRTAARDPDAVALVAVDRGTVVGFVAAVPSVRAFFRRFVARHGAMAALDAAPHLMRPSVAGRAVETARYPAGTEDLPDAELLSIAVAPGYRARGIGAGLTAAVARALGDRGVGELKVVVGADNDGANRFYERVAVRPPRGTAVHEGVSSNVWVLACPS